MFSSVTCESNLQSTEANGYKLTIGSTCDLVADLEALY